MREENISYIKLMCEEQHVHNERVPGTSNIMMVRFITSALLLQALLLDEL
jgi:hypothetical protein